jgi:hypothetical protein
LAVGDLGGELGLADAAQASADHGSAASFEVRRELHQDVFASNELRVGAQRHARAGRQRGHVGDAVERQGRKELIREATRRTRRGRVDRVGRCHIADLILDRNARCAQRGLAMGDASTGVGAAVVDAGRGVVGTEAGALAQLHGQRAPVFGELGGETLRVVGVGHGHAVLRWAGAGHSIACAGASLQGGSADCAEGAGG